MWKAKYLIVILRVSQVKIHDFEHKYGCPVSSQSQKPEVQPVHVSPGCKQSESLWQYIRSLGGHSKPLQGFWTNP